MAASLISAEVRHKIDCLLAKFATIFTVLNLFIAVIVSAV